jgi:VWFA-related protein
MRLVLSEGLRPSGRHVSVVSLCLVASLVLSGESARDDQQFRGGVELVQLDVVVLDGKRQPVRRLSAADFTVLDNGTETPIRAFTPVELARARARAAVWANDVVPDVVTNQAGREEGRLVVILMDRSIPQAEPSVTARKIATRAVEALGPNDLAAVVSTNSSVVQGSAVQNLTADRSRLLRAINAMDPSTDLSPEALAILNKLPGFTIDTMNDTRCLCGVCVPETITRVAEALQTTTRRRKVLLFIGSSMIWQARRPIGQTDNDPGCESRVKDAREAMLAAIDRANVTVHSIDPRGLFNPAPASQASALNQGPRSAQDALRAGLTASVSDRENLAVLPERTGGRTVFSKNNPEQAIPEIIQESESYYVIGIERAVSARPDTTRSIEVTVARRGLRVIAQRRYLALSTQAKAVDSAARAAASPPIETALTGLMPSADTPLSLAMTAFANQDAAKPIVRINVDAGAFARTDGAPVPLELTAIAVDSVGNVVASARQTSTISARRPASGPPVEVNVQSHLELAPGDYGVRVAVSETAGGRVASVFSDITVPKFDAAEISLSDVSVEVASGGASGLAPTTRRVFGRAEHVRAVLQIYQGTERTAPLAPVTMRVQILDAAGGAVRDQSLPFADASFTNRRADCVITLPLATLAPGEYLLRLTASSDRHASSRALRFVVD